MDKFVIASIRYSQKLKMKEPAIMTNRKKCISFIRRLHVTKPMFCRFLGRDLILFTPVSLERNKEILWQRKSFRKKFFFTSMVSKIWVA